MEGCTIYVYTCTVGTIKRFTEWVTDVHRNACSAEVSTLLVFPYFMEQHVSAALPSLKMCDYQVDIWRDERRKERFPDDLNCCIVSLYGFLRKCFFLRNPLSSFIFPFTPPLPFNNLHVHALLMFVFLIRSRMKTTSISRHLGSPVNQVPFVCSPTSLLPAPDCPAPRATVSAVSAGDT